MLAVDQYGDPYGLSRAWALFISPAGRTKKPAGEAGF
jgi:hypothetical protein